jgi:cysteine sulfinate desulfinase/cysteine desulfurase-like protein
MTTGDPICLDHNATTPVLPEVVDAMLPYLREHFGNPSSGHVFGARARAAIAGARAQVAALLGCDAGEVLFTSGGTEANNLAIRGVAEAAPQRRHLVTTVIEHPATARPCAWLERHGHRVTRVDAGGRADLAAAYAAIDAGTALVTVMHANNETGVLRQWPRRPPPPQPPHVRFPDTTGDAVLAGAPEVAASTGSACHEGHDTASAVILAQGLSPAAALGSVRLTLGRGTTADDVARAAAALIASWRRARGGQVFG